MYTEQITATFSILLFLQLNNAVLSQRVIFVDCTEIIYFCWYINQISWCNNCKCRCNYPQTYSIAMCMFSVVICECCGLADSPDDSRGMSPCRSTNPSLGRRSSYKTSRGV